MHRPLARRASRQRRALPTLPLLLAAGALSTAACRGSGAFKISPVSDAMTASTLLGCVAEVAEQSGLPVIEQRTEAPEPTLWARSDSLDAPASTPRRIDVLTVSFKKLGRGLRVLAQTFDVRSPARPTVAAAQLARPTANVRAEPALTGPAADAAHPADVQPDGARWDATEPSLRVAEARDAVLARCGSLGP
jgi:hypothetical protein